MQLSSNKTSSSPPSSPVSKRKSIPEETHGAKLTAGCRYGSYLSSLVIDWYL